MTKQVMVGFSASKSTRDALTNNGERVVSKFMERCISEFLSGSITISADDMDIKNTTISVGLDVAEALKAKAKELGDVPISKLVRVIAEKALLREQAHHGDSI